MNPRLYIQDQHDMQDQRPAGEHWLRRGSVVGAIAGGLAAILSALIIIRSINIGPDWTADEWERHWPLIVYVASIACLVSLLAGLVCGGVVGTAYQQVLRKTGRSARFVECMVVGAITPSTVFGFSGLVLFLSQWDPGSGVPRDVDWSQFTWLYLTLLPGAAGGAAAFFMWRYGAAKGSGPSSNEGDSFDA